ncbi:MAG: MauE/DoxX family redox-associated membrane protein [Desulfarculaceae bacterium]|jgi:uncharacterized membrane protein YphA (DoxX/SURF4 family)
MKTLGETLSFASRLFLAALFIYASYDKVWEPDGFARAVAEYQMLPLWAVNAASALLAWLELIVGIFLLLGLFTRSSALWALGLLLFFTALMLYAEITGASYDCGCFPGQEQGHAAGLDAALRDALFLIPALWLMIRPGRWLRLA